MYHMIVIFLCLLNYVFLPQAAADTVDCSKLPNPIRLHDCCRFPELFKQNALDHCSSSRSNGDQCFYECVFEATEIYRKQLFSYPKAEDYVDWVMKPEEDFSPIYKHAYKKCIEKVQEIKLNQTHKNNEHDCDPLPEMVYLCVQNEMFASCPNDHWNFEVADCVSKRDFISNCLRDESV